MMVVIVEFELRAGAEAEFETALQQMQEQVKQCDAGARMKDHMRAIVIDKRSVSH